MLKNSSAKYLKCYQKKTERKSLMSEKMKKAS